MRETHDQRDCMQKQSFHRTLRSCQETSFRISSRARTKDLGRDSISSEDMLRLYQQPGRPSRPRSLNWLQRRRMVPHVWLVLCRCRCGYKTHLWRGQRPYLQGLKVGGAATALPCGALSPLDQSDTMTSSDSCKRSSVKAFTACISSSIHCCKVSPGGAAAQEELEGCSTKSSTKALTAASSSSQNFCNFSRLCGGESHGPGSERPSEEAISSSWSLWCTSAFSEAEASKSIGSAATEERVPLAKQLDTKVFACHMADRKVQGGTKQK